ncbi:RhoGAP-domain-containing protein [Backusella circina FSU 941]|nr:RhoGAP-domain-containing protein [Backusella circina FSU 941]
MSQATFSAEEIPHLRSQNDQLWKIIEKQRLMIQNLQKDNVRLSAERDGLQDKLNMLEKEVTRKQRVASLFISPQAMKEMAESDDNVVPPHNGPMPPPRSPYRPLKEKTEESDLIRPEESIMNGRSSPGSPAPSPILNSNWAKASSPIISNMKPPQPQRHGSDPAIPTSSKSSSSLEVKRARQRESMLPPVRAALEHDPSMRAASPPLFRPPPPTQNFAVPQDNYPYNAMAAEQVHPTSVETTQPAATNNNNNNNNNAFMGGMANISIRVVGSNIKSNDKGKEVISFTLAIGAFQDDQFEERWRVEKLYSDFLTLDSKLKSQRKSGKTGKLPDKALFTTNSPSKVDQRKNALEQYLQHIVSLSLEDNSDLCEFLSTNVLDSGSYKNLGSKEGYLTKRGKNFGGWKTRYFVLNENVLEYYESKEGTQLGAIRLTNAQIGRQMPGSSSSVEDTNSAYRHAFLIVEQKRSNSSHYVRHILCANSDDDRDEWVQALLLNIQVDENDKNKPKKAVVPQPRSNEKPKLSKGEIRPIAAQPISHMKLDSNHAPDMDKLTMVPSVHIEEENRHSPSISSDDSAEYNQGETDRPSFDQYGNSLSPRPPVRRSSMDSLSASSDNIPRSPSPNLDGEAENERKTRNKANRMTFWGKKMFSNSDGANLGAPPRPTQSSSATTSSSTTEKSGGFRGFLSRTSHEQNDRRNKGEEVPLPSNPVFGVPLEEAVRVSRVAEGYELPAIVYRCIEYLDAMNAVLEEGIYRLSGSNATIKALRERFNREGDVNLLETKDSYDIHVVAGVLKMWLRELPTSVLTREHRMDFLHVIDRKDRVNELGRLVSVLPLANYTLLRALTAHLIRVVQHSDINKMTMRNVSIVFSPTLGIPATIFNLFMSEFEYIFWTTEDGDAAPRKLGEEEEEEPEEEIAPVAPIGGLSRKTTLRLREEHGRSNRNSVNYMDGAPEAIVDLEKHMDGPPVLDEDEEEVDELTLTNDSGYQPIYV